MKNEIKADVEEELPPNSSGIVALFEEQWVNDVKKARANADNLSTREVDPEKRRRRKGERHAGRTG